MIEREYFRSSIFKYLKREHAELMLEGKVRIGTLGNFRSIEKHGPQIGDLNEGVMDYFHLCEHDPFTDKELFPDMREMGIGFGSIEERGMLSDVHIKFKEPVKIRDYFIYSAVKDFDSALFKVFSDYDCCIEIIKPDEFFNAIINELAPYITIANVASCQYGEKKVIWDHGLVTHPALIKGEEYSHQNEVRLYCKPKADFPSPILVSSKRIANCVKLKDEL